MNRHIVAATIAISLFASFSCTLICDVDELKSVDNGASGDSDSDVDVDDCEGGRYDGSTGLCWQDPKTSGTYEWQEAIDYCGGLDLAGHTDWYLPGRDYFIELLGDCDSDVTSGDPGYCNSCDESGTCSALFGSDGDWYWSSSPYGSNLAWDVGFYGGHVYYGSVDSYRRVRCVR